MATATADPCVEQIGEAAGLIWQTLDVLGPLSLTKLVKEVQTPRDIVLQGIGWLAREDKIRVENGGRGRTISLC